MVGLTDQTLSCAARPYVATAARRTACLHVSRAMQAARRRSGFDFTSRLGRRAEAGPRQVLRRVRRRMVLALSEGFARFAFMNKSLPALNSVARPMTTSSTSKHAALTIERLYPWLQNRVARITGIVANCYRRAG